VAAVALVAALAAQQAIRRGGPPPAGGAPLAAMPAPGGREVRYAEPADRFAVTVPASWTVSSRPADRPGEMAFFVFRGPDELELWIRLADVGYDRFEEMADDIRSQTNLLGVAEMEPEIVQLGNGFALRRRIGWIRHETLLVDLLVGTTNHHLQFAAPKGRLDAALPLFERILGSYEVRPAACRP